MSTPAQTPDPWAVVSHEPVTADPWAVVSHVPTERPIPGTGFRPPQNTHPNLMWPPSPESVAPVREAIGSFAHGLGIPTSMAEANQAIADKRTPQAGLEALAGPVYPLIKNLASTSRVAWKGAQQAGRAVMASTRGDVAGTAKHGSAALGYAAGAQVAPFLGEGPTTAGEQFARGEIAKGVGSTAAVAVPLLLAKLGGPKAIEDVPRGTIETAPKHIEALTGFLKKVKTDPHTTASTALPEARAVAARQGINPEAFEGRRGGELVTGKGGILDTAIKEHRAEYAAIRAPHTETMMDTTPIAQAYLDKVTPEMRVNAPEIANRITAEARKFADVNAKGEIIGVKPQTLGQLDDFRQRLNNELDSYYQKSADTQLRSDVEVKADKAALDSSRKLVYQTLSRQSGVDESYIRNLQHRYGALVEARRDLTTAFNTASGAQGDAVAGSLKANLPGSGRFTTAAKEKLAHTYPSQHGATRTVIRETIGPKPLAVFNQRLKLMFDGIGNVSDPGAIRPPVNNGQITADHVAQENAYYTQARSELGAEAPPQQVIQRAQQLKLQQPVPPSGTATQPSLSGAQRTAAIATVMASLKRGEITQGEADKRIQRLNGGGGRKLVRTPQQPY